MSDHSDTLSIEDLAARLGRSTNTIRQWMKRSDFPKAAQPAKEGGRGKFLWTTDQVEAIETYARERASTRGWSGYHKALAEAAKTKAAGAA